MKRTFTFAFIFGLVVLLYTTAVSAQTAKFKWQTELCEFEGTYDSAKYTEKQLRNTQELMTSVGVIPLFTDATAAKYEDIKNLSVAKLEKEYRERSAWLKNLEIVKDKYWETVRQKKLVELEQYYKLARITIEAYENPAKLKEYKRAEFCLDFYAEPLITGGDYLLATWLKVNMDSRQRNASPERLKQRFDTQNASPDRLKFARVEVMSFGWWNCAIKTIEYVESDEQISENFNRLFKNVKEISCDEP